MIYYCDYLLYCINIYNNIYVHYNKVADVHIAIDEQQIYYSFEKLKIFKVFNYIFNIRFKT